MMHGHEKSDPATVARKLANKADWTVPQGCAAQPNAAEPVEREAGTEGNADQQSTRRTQSRESVSQALERIRQVASNRSAVTHLRWEPDAGKPNGRFCGGGWR